MKRLSIHVAVTLMPVGLFACGGSESPVSAPEDAAVQPAPTDGRSTLPDGNSEPVGDLGMPAVHDSTAPKPTDGAGGPIDNPLTNPTEGPAAGNPRGSCAIPDDAKLADVSQPRSVVGNGTPASCTSKAVVEAVAKGGVITFDCGPAPVTIMMEETAKIVNDTGPEIVLDGGGKVTLSGMGQRRILYMNTCDKKQKWTTSHCNNQDHPRLTVQNLTFVDGNSKAETDNDGGGAIFASGGRFKVLNSRFFRNVCAETGPDVGGAGIRVFQQFENRPAYVVNCTFGGAPELGNACSNGGGVSSIGVSWTILNSVFTYNEATGNGANPAKTGTPGGGSGGAIYNDGNEMTLKVCGTLIENNHVLAHGGAIFFVTNNHTGNIELSDSIIRNNPGGTWYPKYEGISHHDDTPVDAVRVTFE